LGRTKLIKKKKTKKKKMKKGINLYENNEFTESIKFFNKNLKDPISYFWIGRNFIKLKKYKLAFECLSKYASLNPQDSIVFYYICKCISKGISNKDWLYFSLNIGLCLNYFYIATYYFPKNANLYYLQCIYILTYRKEILRKKLFDPYSECLRLIEKSINLEKTNCLYYKLRGTTYLNMKMYDKALDDFLYSNELYKKYGMYFIVDNKPIYRFRKDKNNHFGYLKIAVCYFHKGNFLKFNQYLSFTKTCKCVSCGHVFNKELKIKLDQKKFEIDNWKNQIFKKNVTKW
jgi:tetratricopeptide (TPR) repeat protein